MIKDIIIVALLVQIGIDILSAKAVGRRLNQIEDRFFRKHGADIRHRDRETQARSEQIRTLKQRLHNEVRKNKILFNRFAEKSNMAVESMRTAFYAINELQAKARKNVER